MTFQAFLEDFKTYSALGFDHISDPEGYDHILFIATLCAIYRVSQWRQILILATAFTLGHSITLALYALDIFQAPQDVVEFFIPVTIAFTAIANFIMGAKKSNKTTWPHYISVLTIGLIHGTGFSFFFSSLTGKAQDISLPLFSFNLGVEGGQICIIAIMMGFSYIFLNLLKAPFKYWNGIISGVALLLSLKMMWERVFW